MSYFTDSFAAATVYAIKSKFSMLLNTLKNFWNRIRHVRATDVETLIYFTSTQLMTSHPFSVVLHFLDSHID